VIILILGLAGAHLLTVSPLGRHALPRVMQNACRYVLSASCTSRHTRAATGLLQPVRFIRMARPSLSRLAMFHGVLFARAIVTCVTRLVLIRI